MATAVSIKKVPNPTDCDPCDDDHLLHGIGPKNKAPRRAKRQKRPIEEYEYFFAVACDLSTRQLIKRVSLSLKQDQHDEVLEPVVRKFISVVKKCSRGNGDPWRESTTTKVSDAGASTISARSASEKQLFPYNQNSSKRLKLDPVPNIGPVCRSGELQSQSTPQDWSEPPEHKRQVFYRLDEGEKWFKWFGDAFRAVQQVSCRIIAKEWIKTIHPKKQSTNPYNGKVTGSRENGNSELTKPTYWPRDVIHKEPDHINKDQRTKLLVHLLMSTPHQELSISGTPNYDKEIKAMCLKESLDKKSDELRSKWHIIEQIIHVRHHLEMFEEGGFDGSTMLSVDDFSDPSRVSAIKSDEVSEKARNETETHDCAIGQVSTSSMRGIPNVNREPYLIQHSPTQSLPLSPITTDPHLNAQFIPSDNSTSIPQDREVNMHTKPDFQGTYIPSGHPLEHRSTAEHVDQAMELDANICNPHMTGGQQEQLPLNSPAQMLPSSHIHPSEFQKVHMLDHWHGQSFDLQGIYDQNIQNSFISADLNEDTGNFGLMYHTETQQPVYFGGEVINEFDLHENQQQHPSQRPQPVAFDMFGRVPNRCQDHNGQAYFTMPACP